MSGITGIFNLYGFTICRINDALSDELIERLFKQPSDCVLHSVPPIERASVALP